MSFWLAAPYRCRVSNIVSMEDEMRTPRPADPAIPADALADHSPDVPAGTLRKVTLAAAAGTVVEWFDFAIYGFLATILAAQFFPHGDPLVSLLETFAVFAVAFALRPVGGAVFGVLGDRVGRKRILALTVLLMSGSTLAIGLLPTASTIGVWAAVLLVICRSLQGLSAGGEYAGAVAYVIEHAPSHRRSRYSSAMPAATFASFSAAALICFGLTAALGEQQMNSWGWRLPFLLAGPMGLVAFYIRQKLDETPAFKEALAHVEDTTEHSGLRSTIRSQWRQLRDPKEDRQRNMPKAMTINTGSPVEFLAWSPRLCSPRVRRCSPSSHPIRWPGKWQAWPSPH